MDDGTLEKQILEMLKLASERDERIADLQRKLDRLLKEKETPHIAGPFLAFRWPRRDGTIGGFSIQLVFPLISRMLGIFRKKQEPRRQNDEIYGAE